MTPYISEMSKRSMSQTNSQSTQAEECGVSKLSAEVETLLDSLPLRTRCVIAAELESLQRKLRIANRDNECWEKAFDEEKAERIKQTKIKHGVYFEQVWIRPTYDLDPQTHHELQLIGKLYDLKFEYIEAAFLEDPTKTAVYQSSGKTVEILKEAKKVLKQLEVIN